MAFSLGWVYKYAKNIHRSANEAVSKPLAMHLFRKHLVPSFFHRGNGSRNVADEFSKGVRTNLAEKT